MLSPCGARGEINTVQAVCLQKEPRRIHMCSHCTLTESIHCITPCSTHSSRQTNIHCSAQAGRWEGWVRTGEWGVAMFVSNPRTSQPQRPDTIVCQAMQVFVLVPRCKGGGEGMANQKPLLSHFILIMLGEPEAPVESFYFGHVG